MFQRRYRIQMFWIVFFGWFHFKKIHKRFLKVPETRKIVADLPAYQSFDWVDPNQVDCKYCIYMRVSKNYGYPKMDGENNGKPH